ncbi:alpha/beta hydrolase [Corynebacterium breve]|uniref:Alpha/beta hydrolase n=1 Tax=Corynebacterium breve TaxID=3049799 RepID=A0ABY8VFN3_9CORY|nr:alpha/beta hydrolase [Corynebacterium breve]WIM67448.1 alpha/beta hydrolase [Corynebacterium breve]
MTAPSPQPFAEAAGVLGEVTGATTTRAAQLRFAVSVLREDGFDGPAADSAMQRFSGLAEQLTSIVDEINAVIPVLQLAGIAENFLTRAIEAASTLAGFSSETPAFVALMQLERRRLDAQLATLILQHCQHVSQPILDRLYLHPDDSLSDIHQRNSVKLSDEHRGLIESYNGVVLESGSGGITVLLGTSPEDVDRLHPRAITTMVAGVGSSRESSLAGYLDRGQRFSDASGAPTVVWLGYTAPDSVIPPGALSRFAHQGADDLSDFQATLHERFPDARKNVVAHSYGTVVATESARAHGLFADNLVLMASPGVPAAHVSQLHLYGSSPRVTVVDAALDPIRVTRGDHGAIHGANPRSLFFGADETIVLPSVGHSSHWSHPRILELLARMSA